jgi:hypothetical protein
VRSEAPAETGEVVHFGAMGLGQAGVLQAETVAAEAEAEAASEAGATGRNRQE